jgi:serine/threonine-protein kinase
MPDVFDRLKAALADRYAIEREIGSGGMATVYLAEDLKHRRKVAVKVLDPELARTLGAERFLREVEVTANLNHPHILPLHDSGEADGFLLYVMPYVEGETLRERMSREGQLPNDDALQIIRDVAAALSYAHSHDVIHRDIKPENILLSAGEAVVADFGIAKAISEAGGESLTETGISIGTPAYMSPEQASGEHQIDGRSDIYALGCVLYEMLAGEPPFTAPTAQALLAKKLSEATPHISTVRETVPDVVEYTVSKAIAKAPADRFTTAQQFIEALSAERASMAQPRAPVTRPVLRRNSALISVLVVVVMFVLVGRQLLTSGANLGPPPSDRPYTVLATVSGSADSAMRETVEFLLRSGLDMAHVIQTVPSTDVRRLLSLMERPETIPLDPATARELAERAGVSTMVLPRCDAMGNGFLVAVRVEEAVSGRLLAEASHLAADQEALVATVDAVSKELRRDLGETRGVLANTMPLPQALTPSLEALRLLRDGGALHASLRPRQAIPLYREALRLDPEFGVAHVALMAAYNNAGDQDSALVYARQALEAPHRLHPIQRRAMEGRVKYDSDFTFWDETMLQTGWPIPDALTLADFQYLDSAWTVIMSHMRDQMRLALRFDPERQLSTDRFVVWRNATRLAIATGMLEELDNYRDSLGVHTAEYCELLRRLASNDWEGADSVRFSAPNLWSRHVMMRIAVTVLDVGRGRIREGLERTPLLKTARVTRERIRLMLEVIYDVPSIDSAVSLTDRGREAVDRYVVHGVRSAILGDTTEAKLVAARLQSARDSATSELFERAFEPMFLLLEAGIAKQRGDWDEARELLEPLSEKLAQPGYGFNTDRLLVRWVLADVYAHLGQSNASVQQLETLLQERTVEPLYVLTHAPSHFKLGRLYTETGDTARALDHYSAFLDAFTDPDPEYEWMVDEARLEVDTLGAGR